MSDDTTRCELCDLPLNTCPHGHTSTPKPKPDVAQLEVSPRHVAHLPGCSHKDDDDFTRWGLITRDARGAWEALRTHDVRCDAGNQPDLVATGRCRDCIERDTP